MVNFRKKKVCYRSLNYKRFVSSLQFADLHSSKVLYKRDYSTAERYIGEFSKLR